MRSMKPFSVLLPLALAMRSAEAAPPVPMNWTVDGVQREALVFAPSAGTAQDRHPLIFAFHGHGGNMTGASQWGLQDRWPQAIVVYPQGLPTPNKLDVQGLRPGWQRLAGAENDRDLKFFDTMLAGLRGIYRVDDQRIYATGFSNGAFFTLLLWIQRSDVFAGFAIVAGALEPSQHLPSAKPVLQIAGEKDALVTLAKVEPTIAEERRVDQAAAAGQNCGTGCTLYRGDKADVKVVTHPGGHVIPPQATELTVEFFQGPNAAPVATSTASTGTAATTTAAPAGDASKADIIQYKSHGLDLMAFVFRPSGAGPFPVYMWNHGSDHDPFPGTLLAKFWVPQGFVLFAPLRSGHGPNPGSYIGDEQKLIHNQKSPAGFRQLVALHERANDDVIAAYQWIARQPWVDPKRIVVAGGSFGAIQTLLTAERDGREHLGVKCFVAMSPAGESWGNPNWAGRLETAIDAAHAPIFLMQAQNDFNLGPSEVLGPRIDAKGPPNRHKVFPAHGDPSDQAQGHGAFFSDPTAWSDEVLAYLHDCGETK
jgi:polyhydroxybutyrate depolymerase